MKRKKEKSVDGRTTTERALIYASEDYAELLKVRSQLDAAHDAFKRAERRTDRSIKADTAAPTPATSKRFNLCHEEETRLRTVFWDISKQYDEAEKAYRDSHLALVVMFSTETSSYAEFLRLIADQTPTDPK